MDSEEDSERTTAASPPASRENKRRRAAILCKEPNKGLAPRAVVEPELLDDRVSLRDAWVATLKEKRDISSVMRILSNFLPGMSHLKRCSGKRLVLAFAAPDEAGSSQERRHYAERRELENLLTNSGLDLSIFLSEFEVMRVPSCAQRTKAQANAASAIWPINFHPDPTIERILSGCWFDSSELDVIDRCMGACIEAASRKARGNRECDGSAIVFDPMAKEIVAVAASSIHLHPMWHSAILAIDIVARIGGKNGGAYELYFLANERSNENTSLDITDASRKRKHSTNLNESEEIIAYPNDLADIARRFAQQAPNDTHATSAGYLCTDYWIFLLREPCPLCAMALLHSRVSNVFYGATNDTRGVLGSRALLHTTPGLNHRYRVWKGVREKECRDTLDELSQRMDASS